MMPKHAFDISLSKFTLVYKLIMCIVVLTLVFAALGVGALYPIISPLIQEMQDVHLFKALGGAINSLFINDYAAQTEMFSGLKIAYNDFIAIFTSSMSAFWLAFIVLFLLIIVYKFFVNIFIYSASDITNNFMNSASKFGFTSNVIANLKSSSKYSLISTLIDAVCMLVSGAVIYLFAWLSYKVSIFLMLPVTFIIFVILSSFKNTVFALWLPNMVAGGKSPISALKDGVKTMFSDKNWLVNLGSYTAYWFFGIALLMILTLATFGVALIVLPMYYIVFSRSYNLVFYYNINNLKYYIDKRTVADNNIKIDTQL